MSLGLKALSPRSNYSFSMHTDYQSPYILTSNWLRVILCHFNDKLAYETKSFEAFFNIMSIIRHETYCQLKIRFNY
jgi:hypothetical protein